MIVTVTTGRILLTYLVFFSIKKYIKKLKKKKTWKRIKSLQIYLNI